MSALVDSPNLEHNSLLDQDGNSSFGNSSSEGVVAFPSLPKATVSMPTQMRGTILCNAPELAPTHNAFNLLLTKTAQRSKLRGRNGHFDLCTEDGGLFAGGISFDSTYRRIKQGEFILRNGQAEPIAVCLQERKKVHRANVIYGRTPRFEGDDQPAIQEDGLDFYPHYRIASYNMGPFENRSISIWNGRGSFEPVMAIQVTDHTYQREQICITTLSSEQEQGNQQIYAVLQRCNKSNWAVTIAAGMDPGMALCATMLIRNYVQTFSRKGFEEQFDRPGKTVPP